MFERFSTGLRLARASWSVLKADRSLAIFPVISSIAALLAIVLVLSPWWLGLDPSQPVPASGAAEDQAASPLLWALVLVAGYVTTAIAIFFNVALAACATRSMDGVDTKVSEGIAAASSRLPQILGWAAIAFVAGLLLRALDALADRAPFPLSLLANIGVMLLGMAWSAVTFLVVPTLALERVGPGEALRRSKTLIIQRWGEGLAGNVGISVAVFLCTGLPGIALIGIGVWLGSSTLTLGVLLGGAGLVLLVVGAVVGATLNQVFAVALYRYATNGEIPAGFDRTDMDGAFIRRAAS
jgi:hypothetical protein